jgi:tRNA threonylcarbamoyladenosine biosynthesis protein TsaE
MRFESSSPLDTEKLGFCLGNIVKKGYIISLIGDLGTGKTEFVKGIARGLGVEDYITSPTFTIVNEYQGRLPLYHFDVYRIGSVEEMLDIGCEEYFYGDGLTVIEWADLISDIIPEDHITIHISKDMEEGEDFRSINIEADGEMYDGLLNDIMLNCEF